MYFNSLETGAGGRPYGNMTDDLTDDDDQMQMGRGPGGADMNDEEDELDMEMDPQRGNTAVRQRGSTGGQGNTAGSQQRRQREQPRASYQDDDDF